MICFSADGVEVGRNGKWVEPHGPYGFLCLGLVYLWNDASKCLDIDRIILVQMDLKLKCPITLPLYYDMFEKPFSKIYEENGIFFYQGLPIINYKQLKIPEKVTEIKEIQYDSFSAVNRYIYNNEGPLQYSINRVSGNKCGDAFYDKYRELYSCVLDFDTKTQKGTAIGFETLGKITLLNYKMDVGTLYKHLVSDSCNRLRWEEGYEESYRRSLEYGFLNLSCEIDDVGNNKYNYTSIWDNIDALIALNAQEIIGEN